MNINANQETINHAAASCASHLAKWFGDADEAAKALQEDPVGMVAIAMEAFMKDQRRMTSAALTRPDALSRLVLDLI